MSIPPANKRSRRAFTLAEVAVATMVMAIMMVSLLSVVQYAGGSWQRSQMTINLTSEANLVLDYIERELDSAIAVDVPVAGQPATYTLRYAKKIYDGVSMPLASFTFEVVWPYAWTNVATTTLMARVLTTGDSRFVGSSWVTGTTGADNTLVADRYTFEIGRHIASFTTQRSGSRKLMVGVLVHMPQDEDGDGNVDPDSPNLKVERTMFLH